MAYDPGAIDLTLASAVGDDRELVAELRGAFLASAARALGQLEAAAGAGEWSKAAAQLRGLAGSFGAVRLMALADAALRSGPEPATLARLRRAIARL